MTPFFYFGPNIRYAVTPHEPDYANRAILLHPHVKRLDGELHVHVYLSSLSLEPACGLEVKVYWGDPLNQAHWFDPAQMIKHWHFNFEGLADYLEAPVENCIWTASTAWEPLKVPHFRLHEKRYAIIASVVCTETNQTPTQPAPATDPCAAVQNSLTFTDAHEPC